MHIKTKIYNWSDFELVNNVRYFPSSKHFSNDYHYSTSLKDVVKNFSQMASSEMTRSTTLRPARLPGAPVWMTAEADTL